MTNSENVALTTDAKNSLIFDGGRVYQVTSTRLRIEFGTSWQEMEFDEWVSWLRHDRVANDRKKFAAMAMQGLASNAEWEADHNVNQTAREAIEYADALLKELAK